jgi:hypothetical protein
MGGLFVQSVRCGKESCRCAKGDLHTGYLYLITREDGKLKKRYVPRSAEKRLRSIIEESRFHRWRKVQERRAGLEAVRSARLLLSSPGSPARGRS